MSGAHRERTGEKEKNGRAEADERAAPRCASTKKQTPLESESELGTVRRTAPNRQIESALDRTREAVGDVRPDAPQRLEAADLHLLDDDEHGLAAEERPTRKALIEDHAEHENIDR